MRTSVLPDPFLTKLNYVDLSMKTNSSRFRLVTVYQLNQLESTTIDANTPVFIGDFNIHVDNNSSIDAGKFLESLYTTGFQQHIHEPTHRSGHTLDLLISRASDDLIVDVNIVRELPSDHAAVVSSFSVQRPPPTKKKVTFRKFRDLNIEQFKQDISFPNLLATLNPSDAVEQYNSSLLQLIDEHIPAKTSFVSLRPNAPWYTEEIRESKRLRRRAERTWIKTGLEVHRQIYSEQCRIYYQLIGKAKSEYLTEEITSCDNKNLFRFVRKLSTVKSDPVLPDHESDEALANDFAAFFYNKVNTVTTSLENTSPPVLPVVVADCESEFTAFELVTESQVRKVIMECPSKSCKLDPIPTWLVKSCIDILLPYITHIINISLSSGSFPEPFKMAHVVPLLKKSNLTKLNHNELCNYRPIANLMFLGKVLEKIATAQLRIYLHDCGLFSMMQSAYRSFHSTETALIQIYNDMLIAVDKGLEAVVVLLDYSSAFDTIDHQIVVERLQRNYGVTGSAIKLLESYLEGRRQTIVVNDSLSYPRLIPWGVPQGSVLGPLEFILYTGPLGDVIDSHKGVQHVMYADDTQLYIIMKQNEHDTSLTSLSNCITDIRQWSTCNSLLLNDSKTKVIHITSQFRCSSSLPDFTVGTNVITPSKDTRDLGVLLDDKLDMREHIRNTCRSAAFGIHKIGKLRRYLDQGTTERLVHAFVSSHLDYCNSLYVNLPISYIAPLQRIQNAAARLVSRTRKFDHITPVLRSLHWLPVSQRIKFKILLLTYKANNGLSPQYITNMLTPMRRSVTLRSSSHAHLQLTPGPRTHTRYGDRAFSVAAPSLWNDLPVHVRDSPSLAVFKRKLKTFLFDS